MKKEIIEEKLKIGKNLLFLIAAEINVKQICLYIGKSEKGEEIGLYYQSPGTLIKQKEDLFWMKNKKRIEIKNTELAVKIMEIFLKGPFL